jgi:predicted nuclease of predicted toxin-antitoxin system
VNLLVDENISHRIVERLQRDGHTLVLVRDVAFGYQDRDILELARQRSWVILTEDTDFGELVMQHHLPSAGVILLRLSGIARTAQPDFTAQAIATHSAALPGAFSAISPTGVRIRPLP